MDVRSQPQHGWIEVITGSMFSGKSEELIRRLRRAQIARQRVQIFKPLIDNRYGDDHIIYCGEYVKPDHEYMKMSEDALADLFVDALKTFNPEFRPDWIRKRWVFRTPYAQPIPLVNHSRNIPDMRTPIPGFYLANMSLVYPWDRGTNYAVRIGRQAAARLLADITPVQRPQQIP